jgi:hypothetical protein
MITPTKYSNLKNNALVQGSQIINLLKKRPFYVDDLFGELSKQNSTDLSQYYECLTFLFAMDLIYAEKHYIYLKRDMI